MNYEKFGLISYEKNVYKNIFKSLVTVIFERFKLTHVIPIVIYVMKNLKMFMKKKLVIFF